MIKSIKEKIIKDFIKSNYRAPTQSEIKNLYDSFLNEQAFSEQIGIISSKKNAYPIVGNESSSKDFNELINDLKLDQKEINERLESYLEDLEIKFRVFNKKINNSLKIIDKLERIANKNILLYLKEDIYSYGIVESFKDYDKIDFNKSNITMFNGKVTLGFDKLVNETFKSNNFSYTVSSRYGYILKQVPVGNMNNVLKEDGRYFKVIAYSKYPDDICEMSIDITFPEQEGIEINTLKFVSLSPEINSKLSYKCYYSKDLTNLKEVFESNQRVTSGENYIEINEKNVKRVKIVLCKYNYDYKERDEYAYVFSLDFLGHTSASYKVNKESTLYLGPYEILDENENPVNFSMATVKGGTCCIVPDESSIDMYLSKDNINWIKADFNGNSKQVIQFEESEESNLEIFDFVDLGSQANFIAQENIPEEISLNAKEKLFNLYVREDKAKELIRSSLRIERNVLNKSNEKLYNANSGWEKVGNDFYETSFEIFQMEGRYIDFGENSCFIDKKQISGKVFLTQGIHTFKTSTENWLDLNLEKEEEIKSLRQLKSIDKLYPYNHKYIIEGFNYARNFKGKKVYKGADKVFCHLMKEVSNQRFKIETSRDVYTIVEVLGNLYIKIKSNKNTSESKLEEFFVSYRKRNTQEESSKLYIKAILKTFNEKVTPKIEQIQVRVI